LLRHPIGITATAKPRTPDGRYAPNCILGSQRMRIDVAADAAVEMGNNTAGADQRNVTSEPP
jgi:hypothetical protein